MSFTSFNAVFIDLLIYEALQAKAEPRGLLRINKHK